MLDKLLRVNLLFDIYSTLLTPRQREVLQLYYSDNLSLGEISAEYGISRQAVYDLIRRAVAALEQFESKLGLYARFQFQQERLEEADRLLNSPRCGEAELARLKEIVRELRRQNEQ